jgi:hypothetical protein
MNAIEKAIEEHDKFYEYSDDMRAYSKGKSEYHTIIKMIQDLGKSYNESLDIYRALTTSPRKA